VGGWVGGGGGECLQLGFQGCLAVLRVHLDLCERGQEASTTNGDKHQSIMAQHEGRFPQLWHAWLT
jgi:hypothetical protein